LKNKAARNRTAKSSIIFQTLQLIKRSSPETGGFVKQDPKTNWWYAVDDSAARTTTAQAFRDELSSVYRSSKRAKQQRRWNRKAEDCSDDEDEEEEEEAALFAVTEDNVGEQAGRLGLSSVIDEALGMVEEMLPLLPVSTGSCTDYVPIAPRPQEIPSWEQQFSLQERTGGTWMGALQPAMDFEAIWTALGLHANVSDNPYEPTPISPSVAREKKDAPLAVAVDDMNRGQCVVCGLKDADTFGPQSSHAITAASAASANTVGLSLRQALFCDHERS
jgi:hypothetical protein